MLLPMQFAILTVEEARLLMTYIDTSTASKGHPTRDYDKMREKGVMDMYNRLRDFVETADHYAQQLRTLDTSEFARNDHDH